MVATSKLLATAVVAESRADIAGAVRHGDSSTNLQLIASRGDGGHFLWSAWVCTAALSEKELNSDVCPPFFFDRSIHLSTMIKENNPIYHPINHIIMYSS
jgi:hypothetical protein